MRSNFLKVCRSWIENRIHAHDASRVLANSNFEWRLNFESRHAEIQREADAVLKHLSDVINFGDVLSGQRALIQNDDWKSYFLIALRDDLLHHQAECPATTRALRSVPGIINAFFSILTPGAEIPVHRGPYAGILRYHFAVRIPQGDTALLVGDTLCRWIDGESLFFDDSYPHSAWNRTRGIRVILFVDFARPLPQPLATFNRIILGAIGSSRVARLAKRRVFGSQLVAGSN